MNIYNLYISRSLIISLFLFKNETINSAVLLWSLNCSDLNELLNWIEIEFYSKV